MWAGVLSGGLVKSNVKEEVEEEEESMSPMEVESAEFPPHARTSTATFFYPASNFCRAPPDILDGQSWRSQDFHFLVWDFSLHRRRARAQPPWVRLRS